MTLYTHPRPKRMVMPIAALSTLLSLFAVCIAPVAYAENSAVEPAGKPAAASASSETATTSVDSPVPVIEAFHAGLLDIMKHAKELGIEGRIERLAPLMAETFDLDFMASKTVGRHWGKFSDADKVRWEKAFADFTFANYAGRFTGWKGEEFITLGVEDAARNTRVVLTKIVVPNEDDVQLNYRVIEKDGVWRVIDVYLNGTVSELALRRSEYSTALKREGFEQLIASIQTKIQDLKDKGQADG